MHVDRDWTSMGKALGVSQIAFGDLVTLVSWNKQLFEQVPLRKHYKQVHVGKSKHKWRNQMGLATAKLCSNPPSSEQIHRRLFYHSISHNCQINMTMFWLSTRNHKTQNAQCDEFQITLQQGDEYMYATSNDKVTSIQTITPKYVVDFSESSISHFDLFQKHMYVASIF